MENSIVPHSKWGSVRDYALGAFGVAVLAGIFGMVASGAVFSSFRDKNLESEIKELEKNPFVSQYNSLRNDKNNRVRKIMHDTLGYSFLAGAVLGGAMVYRSKRRGTWKRTEEREEDETHRD